MTDKEQEVKQNSENGKSVAVRQDYAYMPPTFHDKYKMAQILVKSGLLPSVYNTPEKVIIALQMGHELGLKPMVAINNIAVINGRPTLGANLMMAVINGNPEFHSYVEEYDNEDKPTWCKITIGRKKNGGVVKYSSKFSLEDAETAGLITKDTWKKYPKAMMTARAISATAKKAFPDILAGIYTPEEMTETTERLPENYEIGTTEPAPKKTEPPKVETPPAQKTAEQDTPPPETEINPIDEFKRDTETAIKNNRTQDLMRLMNSARATLGGPDFIELAKHVNSLTKKGA